MTYPQWRQLQLAIRDSIFKNTDFVSDFNIFEDHKGAFIAFIDHSGEVVYEEKFLKDKQNDLVETARSICQIIRNREMPALIESTNVHLCVVREAVYIKDPLDWNVEKDGIWFQWGNSYKAWYMPYNIINMNGDKVRILDKLCSWRAHVPSSLWRVPCGLIFKILVDWYK